MALAAMVWLMSLAYGFQYLTMGNVSSHLTYFRIATVPFVALVIVLTWFAASRSAVDWRIWSVPRWLGTAMMSISWLLTCYFYPALIAPVHWALPAIAIPIAAFAAALKAADNGSVAVFLAAFLGLSIVGIFRLPADTTGDMLQIIDFAARDLLRGESPFQPYLTSSGKEVPFGYWPGVWLPYVPLIALGVDMRVFNLCMFALILLLYYIAAGSGARAATILAVALLPFLLSSQLLQMVLFGHLWLYWLFVCGTLYLVVLQRYLLAATLLGLCLATRPTVLFLMAPLAAYVWSRGGFLVLLKSSLVALAVVAAANLPFALMYGESFLANSYGRMIGFSQVLTHFSVAGVLRGASLQWLNLPIQVLIAIALFTFVFLRRSLAPPQFIILCGLAYIWEVLFASYATRYVYFPGFLLIALGIAVTNNERISPPVQLRSC